MWNALTFLSFLISNRGTEMVSKMDNTETYASLNTRHRTKSNKTNKKHSTKNPRWTNVLVNSKQVLFLIKHQPYYLLIFKPGKEFIGD